MPARKLQEFLDAHGVKYVTIRHSLAYSAQEVAASAHVRGPEMAKTVMVKLDGRLAMAVLPASERVDLDRLREVTGHRAVELATEAEFRGSFPECEAGAMPPFGNLWDMEVFVEPRLAQREEIAFNAGTHTELFRLAWRDFERLVKPRIVHLSRAN